MYGAIERDFPVLAGLWQHIDVTTILNEEGVGKVKWRLKRYPLHEQPIARIVAVVVYPAVLCTIIIGFYKDGGSSVMLKGKRVSDETKVSWFWQPRNPGFQQCIGCKQCRNRLMHYAALPDISRGMVWDYFLMDWRTHAL